MASDEQLTNGTKLPPTNEELPIRYVDKDTEEKEDHPYELIAHSKIRLAWSKVATIGVFSTNLILKDEIIERCPVDPLQWRVRYIGDPSLYRNCFMVPLCPCEDCKRDGNQICLMYGYGSIYNHQSQPHANAVMDFNKSKQYIDIVASKDIQKGSEIFIHYGEKFTPMNKDGTKETVLIKDE